MLDPSQAMEAGRAKPVVYQGMHYVRYLHIFQHAPRGTAVFEDTTVFGYPSIGRILVLQSGLASVFEAPFWAEEKIDGYNVRIFQHHGTLLALTRGGFVCPFSTDRAGDFIDPAVFEEQPDLVICAEIAGPDQPYLENSPGFIRGDIDLFVFDLMRKNRNGFLPHEEKIQLLDHFQLPGVQSFGRFHMDDIPKIRDILRRLNEEDREGLVFKEDSQRDKRTKYVTGNSSIVDIEVTAEALLELPCDYFLERVFRTAMFYHEHDTGDLATTQRRLGAAFLDGLNRALAQYTENQKVFHTYRCRFHKKENALGMMTQLENTAGKQLQLEQRSLEQDRGMWLLCFDRTFPTMTGMFSHQLKGGMSFD